MNKPTVEKITPITTSASGVMTGKVTYDFLPDAFSAIDNGISIGINSIQHNPPGPIFNFFLQVPSDIENGEHHYPGEQAIEYIQLYSELLQQNYEVTSAVLQIDFDRINQHFKGAVTLKGYDSQNFDSKVHFECTYDIYPPQK